MKEYKVIGGAEVAGVEPGGTVTEQELTQARALIEPLLGVHLVVLADEPAARTTAKTTAKTEGGKS